MKRVDLTIIIAGAGKVGATLAEHLADEGHSVTIVDVSGETLDRLGNQLDVMCLKGNCVSREMLLEAGCKETDVLIAATGSDEINLLCCHIAHRLGVPYTVARVRGTEYAAAQEISRLLRVPSAFSVETFARGRVELVSFSVQEGDFLAGRTLASQSSKIQDLPMLLCAVERGDEVFIPNGASLISAGDRVSIAGTPSGINQFFKLLGRQTHRIRDVFIIGGGRIAFYLLAGHELQGGGKGGGALPGAGGGVPPGPGHPRGRYRPGAAHRGAHVVQ